MTMIDSTTEDAARDRLVQALEDFTPVASVADARVVVAQIAHALGLPSLVALEQMVSDIPFVPAGQALWWVDMALQLATSRALQA